MVPATMMALVLHACGGAAAPQGENHAPVAADMTIRLQDVVEFTGNLPRATDPDRDAVTYELSRAPHFGAAAVNQDGSFRYRLLSYSGSGDSFGYRVKDGHGGQNTYTLTVIANRSPVAVNTSFTIQQDTVLSAKLPAATDPDGDAIIFEAQSDPAHGYFQFQPDGNFTYQPWDRYFGADGFRYEVHDDRGGSNSYTVNLTIGSSGVGPACVEPDTPAPPAAAEKKIVFSTKRDGNWEIYSVREDGTDLARLTNHPARDYWPAWSPDGTRIAFVSDRTGHSEIYVMNADGSGVVRRTFGITRWEPWAFPARPTWHPDGKRIAFANDDNDIWEVSADCSVAAHALKEAGVEYDPDWSPDGTHLAVVADWAAYDFDWYQVWVFDAAGSGAGWLLSGTFDLSPNATPKWSPDGKRIAFAGLRNVVYWVFVSNSDGSGSPTPLVKGGAPDWSPDGSRIAFTFDSDGKRNIGWVAIDGSASGLIIADGTTPGWQR
jgi:dipeptidyl aminopeptidase/acylaminoacyl peptidase